MVEEFIVTTKRQGMSDITAEVDRIVKSSGINQGLCTVYIRHTSASLVIQENAARSSRVDLENWMNRLVKENDSLYTHVDEGPDDMPSHIKSALTQTSLGIPILDGELVLGTWQGIFLWEHRRAPHHRKIVVHVGS